MNEDQLKQEYDRLLLAFEKFYDVVAHEARAYGSDYLRDACDEAQIALLERHII